MNPRGQFTIVALISVFVVIILYISLYPVLDTIINDNLDQFSGTTQLLVKLLPFFLLLMIVVTGFWYAIPHREYAPMYH